MASPLFDALLGLFSFAGLATLAVSRYQAEWRAVGTALLIVGVAVALVDLLAGGLLVLGVLASRPLGRPRVSVPDHVPPDWED